MTLSEADWLTYIDNMRKINESAAEALKTWIDFYSRNGANFLEAIDAQGRNFFEFATETIRGYSTASSSLAAAMYDRLAELQNAVVAPAGLAPLPTYEEIVQTTLGVAKRSYNVDEVSAALAKLVKLSAADTTLQNVARDRKRGRGKHSGAQFAWIPKGDTCPFCITLASQGWQYQSKWAADNHAEHIHPNCDCMYAVRFREDFNIAGYNPDKYLREYENAGDTRNERINKMRRKYYAEHKDKINEQKREAYAGRVRAEKLKLAGKYESTDYKSVYADYLETAKPGSGRVLIADARKPKNREIINQRLIHKEFGGDIIANKEKNKYKVKNPDYTWRGKSWEEKEPAQATANAIDQNIRNAISQIRKNPGGIMLDIGDSTMPIETVHEIALKRLRRSAGFDCDLILIRNGAIVDITRYKKMG